MTADILVIDLAHIKAGTSWSTINAKPTGLDAVIVNGRVTDTAEGSDANVYGRMLRKAAGD